MKGSCGLFMSGTCVQFCGGEQRRGVCVETSRLDGVFPGLGLRSFQIC